MSVDDAALMFEGWYEDLVHQERIARKIAITIADTQNRTMGGKGASKSIMASWKLPGDAAVVKKEMAEDKMRKRLKQKKINDQIHGIKRKQLGNGGT
jgi:hypothetical protein